MRIQCGASSIPQQATTVVCSCFAVLTVLLCVGSVNAAEGRLFQTNERLTLGTEVQRSASVRLADLDRNKHLDVIVANGRHWPEQNYVYLNQGRASFSIRRPLGDDGRTSYAVVPVDLDGDGDVDLVEGNDMAPNRTFFNDGTGRFSAGTDFGESSSVRSLTAADIDGDGDVDILAACRSGKNRIYFNTGRGQFDAGRPFGNQRDSTGEVAVVDWNGDGKLDLILAGRDGQQSVILLNDGQTNFVKQIPFGQKNDQVRTLAVGDLNGDKQPDLVAGMIGQANHVYLADGKGGFSATIEVGRKEGKTYALAIADMDNDVDLDLIVGNVGQQNAVYFNDGTATHFTEVQFGEAAAATYGLDVGDLDGDGFRDIAVAVSDGQSRVFLNRPARAAPPAGKAGAAPAPDRSEKSSAAPPPAAAAAAPKLAWPSFRGPGARGVATGYPVAAEWNADAAQGELRHVLWQTPVPGLGHSSPVIQGERLYLATAIAADGKAPLKVERDGKPDAADDNGEQSWGVLCYDRRTGKELWRQTAHKGTPRATRHAKATHANTTLAVEGDNVVACFGSEGVHCFDLDGKRKWSRDLGVMNISKYGIGWGYASSPSIHQERIVIVCDDPENPYVAALQLADGKEIWRTSRKEICERSWGTPCIHATDTRTQVVLNGYPWIASYDLKTGDELWRLRGGGDNPVPTPFEAHGWLYITNAHGAQSPIFVVRPDARGDISPTKEAATNESLVWSTQRGGSYLSTPVVCGDYLYLADTTGIIRCFHAVTGEKLFEKRIDSGASISASLVAADGKVYCASENGNVYVLEAGPKFNLLATNPMGQPCLATPAICEGILYIRTTDRLVAIK